MCTNEPVGVYVSMDVQVHVCSPVFGVFFFHLCVCACVRLSVHVCIRVYVRVCVFRSARFSVKLPAAGPTLLSGSDVQRSRAVRACRWRPALDPINIISVSPPSVARPAALRPPSLLSRVLDGTGQEQREIRRYTSPERQKGISLRITASPRAPVAASLWFL